MSFLFDLTQFTNKSPVKNRSFPLFWSHPFRRRMRRLVAHGVFEEEIGDRFRLNAAGELMRRDVPGSQRSATTCSTNETSERAPQKIPVASATTPAVNQTMTQIWLSETPTDRAA